CTRGDNNHPTSFDYW
nr:immunoglobulin heavy chain junction region [Macaca mulatta]MOV45692.1 immunoglobulin heavy chain junction region [Macaca mulatta]